MLIIRLIAPFLFLLIFPFSSFATSSEGGDTKGGGFTKTEQSSHPPHDHHDNDHMKYIRGHGSERKKKFPKR